MPRKAIDRLLPLLVALLLLAGAALLANRRVRIMDQRNGAAAVALARAQELLQVKLGALFREWEEDLMEEAEATRTGIDEAQLLDRWAVVLRNHWELLSVRLADERGHELALHRDDTALVVVRTSIAHPDGLPRAQRHGAAADSAEWPWARLGRYDPRERIWFGKALENDRETPIWTIRQFGDTAEKVLQVSLLARRASEGAPFRVIVLDVALDRTNGLDQPMASLLGTALLSSDGRALIARTVDGDAPAKGALAAAIAHRTEHPAERVFRKGAFAAGFEPFGMNGLMLTSCVLVNASAAESAYASDLTAWRVAAAWLALLTGALIALLLRGRARRKEQGRIALQNKQLEYRLDKALGERDVLSREVHHRVKNNLQVVSSLLNLQASSLEDGAVREEFLRGKRRIDTIALVHHRLYDHPDLRDIDLQGFLSQLTGAIGAMHEHKRATVSTSVRTHGVRCDQDTAIELGIIVCELVTNAYQHAFPHATGGHITVEVSRVEGDLHRLVVSNNGVAADRSALSGPGKLGLEIVEALAEQLDGSLHVRSEGAPAFEVLFRVKRAASAESIGP